MVRLPRNLGSVLAIAAAGCASPSRPVGLRLSPDAPGPDDTITCTRGGLPVPDAAWTVDEAPAPPGPTLRGPHRRGARVRCAAGDEGRTAVIRSELAPNLLLVVLDDLGAWDTPLTGLSDAGPTMPTLQRLADEGVVFGHAWSAPVCSPTRAGLLTGRYPHGHHVTTGVGEQDSGLSLDLPTIADVLHRASPRPYTTALFGKWHVTLPRSGHDVPARLGFDAWAFAWSNFGRGDSHYDRWVHNDEQGSRNTTDYAPLVFTERAEAFVATAPEPWFTVLSLPLVHAPYHLPPAALLPPDAVPATTALGMLPLMLRAADGLVARVLDAMPPEVRARTVVVVLGDNGPADEAARPPLDPRRVKMTVYEGGVRVPLVVSGAGVAHARVDAHVDHVDLLPTLAALAGVPLTADEQAGVDGVSFAHLLTAPSAPADRRFGYTEMMPERWLAPWLDGTWRGAARWHRAATDGEFKLVRNAGAPEELYRLSVDPLEQQDLLAAGPVKARAGAAHQQLRAWMDLQAAR